MQSTRFFLHIYKCPGCTIRRGEIVKDHAKREREDRSLSSACSIGKQYSTRWNRIALSSQLGPAAVARIDTNKRAIGRKARRRIVLGYITMKLRYSFDPRDSRYQQHSNERKDERRIDRFRFLSTLTREKSSDIYSRESPSEKLVAKSYVYACLRETELVN